MRILILGHNGMLGRATYRYFKSLPDYNVLTLDTRWGDEMFGQNIAQSAPDFIINCIGIIPQRKPVEFEYTDLNIKLPRYLETLNIPVIHPSTDCEFKGNIAPGQQYTKTSLRDADDMYGMSKATISKEIEEKYKNTKIIRTSIIGHEKSSSHSLLDWFLSQTGNVSGYTNHFWNGITTLEWAKQSRILIEKWSNSPSLNQLGTDTHYSKFDILNIVKLIYLKDIQIDALSTQKTVNKCLKSDFKIPELELQLRELKDFFEK